MPEPILLYNTNVELSNGLKKTDEKETRFFKKDTSVPDYFLFLVKNSKNPVKFVIICPGGGYDHVYFREPLYIAKWLNSNGISAAVLRYRSPNYGYSNLPSDDLKELIKVARTNAKKWNINPQKVGVMGFSAGAHVASTAAVHFEKEYKPDFVSYFSGVFSINEKYCPKFVTDIFAGNQPAKRIIEYYSNENYVNKDTPASFIFANEDDDLIDYNNSVIFFEKLKENSIPAELYIYPQGGHTIGFGKTFKYKKELYDNYLKWLQNR